MASLHASLETQQSILQKYPFTDTRVILQTQHCMHLLCSTVRRCMSPNFPYSTSESWVSLLLLTSTLERILEFFVAVSKDNERIDSSSHAPNWTHRKEFMWRMREDLGHFMAVTGQTTLQKPAVAPTLDLVWFGAAFQELSQRGAIPHSAEEPVHVLHGSAVTLFCNQCYGQS